MFDPQSSRIHPQKWGQAIVLFAFCFLLFFVNLGAWDLWAPDEPRYAQVSREMVNSGDWVLMHLNGKVYAEKPPFFFWAIAVTSFFTKGIHSFSARFPSAFFGTLTVLLTFFLGKRLCHSRAGFFSGLILATNIEFASLATRANIDATFTFFTTASLFCFMDWHENRRKLPIYGFYSAMALATLTKGPVGLVLPLLVSLVYLVVKKDWEALRGMRLFTGFLLLLAIVLCWYLPAVLKGGREYLTYTLFHQTIDRYTEGWSHDKPIYYYLLNFPGEFLPWFVFLPAGVVYAFPRGVREGKKEFLFPLVWFAVIFIFFSFSKGKRSLYLLPLYPAASLIVGRVWYEVVSTKMENVRGELISIPVYGLAAVALVGGFAIPWLLWIKFPSYLVYGFPMVCLLATGSIALTLLWRKKRYGAVFFVIVAIMGASLFYTFRVAFPRINLYRSARYISEEAMKQMKPGEKLAFWGAVYYIPYNFYTGIYPVQIFKKEEDLFRFLESRERVFCLMPYNDFVALRGKSGSPPMELIVRRLTGEKEMALISNR
jgi:4-amino-4-deoxy-L-arabinose transferase-like glycosyltransferase